MRIFLFFFRNKNKKGFLIQFFEAVLLKGNADNEFSVKFLRVFRRMKKHVESFDTVLTILNTHYIVYGVIWNPQLHTPLSFLMVFIC